MGRDAFSKKFSEEVFAQITENLIGHAFTRDTRSISLDSTYKFIKSVKNVGSYNELDLNVLIIEHRSQNDARVGLSKELFSILKKYSMNNAIIATYNTTNTWRYSLLTTNFKIADDGKVLKEFSSPKRYSYLLGPAAKTVTPHKFLQAKGKIKDFDDLRKRFSVEVVNGEFYKEIAKLYDELAGTNKITASLKHPGHGEIRDQFAVRLIGRIIFCWFLREKRSDKGTPLIPHDILSRTASKADNYYHSVLAPLFFEVLNKQGTSREEAFKSGLYGSIPYLNGGLFSPDNDDHYKFDKSLQLSVSGPVTVPDQWLRKFFDLLELYHFTVDENTSYDINLSIDPEMLGRVFENLLARINPENGKSVRKNTGSFYTPREIVEYMVDESLKQYLKTKTKINNDKLAAVISFNLSDDEEFPLSDNEKLKITDALSQVRILDPACGSGAFPIGILQKIVFILQQVDPDSKRWIEKQLTGASPEFRNHLQKEFENKNFNYLRKLGVIRESIYGVDIQPIATEISKLRCFLTLIVDQPVHEGDQNMGIEPLPNLDFKFVTANSLLKLQSNELNKAQTGLFEDSSGIDELKRLREEYFSSHNNKRNSLKLQFADRQNQMLQDMIASNSSGLSDITPKLSAWKPFSHKVTGWFDSEWMFGISTGFNIVIGNPPYLGNTNIENSTKVQLRKDYISAKGKFDLYVPFIEMGVKLLTNSGVLTYICPTAFTKRKYGTAIRSFIQKNVVIEKLVDFEHDQMFDSVTNYTGILSVKNDTPDVSSTFVYMKGFSGDERELIQSELTEGSWILSDHQDSEIRNKVIGNSIPLSEIANVSLGVITGLNKLFLKTLSELDDGKFEKDYFHPALRGEDIQQMRIKTPEKYVFYPYTLEGNKTVAIQEIEVHKTSPRFIEYLRSNIERINRPEYMVKHYQHKKWYELYGHGNIAQLKTKKIVTPELANKNRFAISDKEQFYVDSVCGIVLKANIDITYEMLLGVLNSKLIEWYYKPTAITKANGFFIYKVMYLNPIPIVEMTNKNKHLYSLIHQLVINIQTGLSDDSKDKMLQEIDNHVFELYQLTPKEIKTILEHRYFVKDDNLVKNH